jgi:O-antigen ligase
MIRLTLVVLYVSFFSAFAFRNWFAALCALILMMAALEHPDMPKTIFGIQGLNPWNVLLVAVTAAWAVNRANDGLKWDLPGQVTLLLLLYLAVVLVGFSRMMMDRSYLDESPVSLVSEYLFNTIKWIIPGLLLYDGCRTRLRFRAALLCVLAVYVLLGIQVIKWMPLSSAVTGDGLSARSLKILVNEVGYHRVNISAMLAGATWAVFATRVLASTTGQRLFVFAGTGLLLLAQALTAGRAGYATSGIVFLVLCLVKWRRQLLLAPVMVVAVLVLAPGVAERLTEGFSPDTHSIPTRIRQLQGERDGPDAYTITAGRNIIWPFVVGKIAQSPWIGYGRLAMVRTGLTSLLASELNEGFSHPHNAYLEWLFDNGLIGFFLVMPFYVLMLWYALDLFRDRRSPIFEAVGGATLAFVMVLMVASMGSQSFYPREGWIGMWCLIFLMLRVRLQRERALPPSVAAARTRRFVTSPILGAAPGVASTRPTGEREISRWGSRPRLAPAPTTINETALWSAAPAQEPRRVSGVANPWRGAAGSLSG